MGRATLLLQNGESLARISHTYSSRSGGRGALSALRHARGHPLAGHAVDAARSAAAVDWV